MTLAEILALVPEDKRAEAQSELGYYVKADSVESVKRLIRENQTLKSAFDSEVSIAVKNHDDRFQTEKVPAIVEAEIAKRNPPKDPRDIKLSEMEKKLQDMERASIVEKQTALAVQKAAEKGIPLDIAAKFIGQDNDATIANIEALANQLMPWKEAEVSRGLEARLGSNAAPMGGKPSTPQDAKAKMSEAEAKFAAAKKIGDIAAQKTAADEAFYWQEQARIPAK